jgi:hypothetical protein
MRLTARLKLERLDSSLRGSILAREARLELLYVLVLYVALNLRHLPQIIALTSVQSRNPLAFTRNNLMSTGKPHENGGIAWAYMI